MKKVRVVTALLLALISVFALFGCGDGDGSGKTANKSDVEKLKTNTEDVFNNLESLDYGKFSLVFEQETSIIIEKVKLEYDENGYFHCKQYVKEIVVENGKTPKEYTIETYMWIDGTTLTKSEYNYLKGYNNNIPERAYWVKSFVSVDSALEEFEQYLSERFINNINFLDIHPIDYALNKNYDHIDTFIECLDYYLTTTEGRWSVTIKNNSANNINACANYAVSDGTNSHELVVNNGYVMSYNEVMPNLWNIKYQMALDWTFEEPNLEYYEDRTNW